MRRGDKQKSDCPKVLIKHIYSSYTEKKEIVINSIHYFVLLQEKQEAFQFLLKHVFNEATTGQLLRKQQHPQKKRPFSSFFCFKKLVEKPGPALTVTPKAEEGVTFNSVPATEHRLQLRTYVINAITSSA